MLSVPIFEQKNPIGACHHEWDLHPDHNYLWNLKKCTKCGVLESKFVPSFTIVWPVEEDAYIEFRWREGVTKRYKLEPIINKLEQLGFIQEIK